MLTQTLDWCSNDDTSTQLVFKS